MSATGGPPKYQALSEELTTNVKAQITYRREQRSLTITDVVEQVNAVLDTKWGPQTFGRRGFNVTELVAVAQILDCTVDDLLRPLDVLAGEPVDLLTVEREALRAAGELGRVQAQISKQVSELEATAQTARERADRGRRRTAL